MDTKQQRRTCIAMGRVIPSLRGVFCVQSGWLDVCRWKQLLRDVSSSVREVKVVPSICVGQERLRIWAIVVRVVGDLCHGSLLLFTWRGGTLADKVHKKNPPRVAMATLDSNYIVLNPGLRDWIMDTALLLLLLLLV